MKGIINALPFALLLWCGIFLLGSCGANYHAKRAKHHINKAKEKGAEISVDTVFKEVEIIVPELRVQKEIEYKTLRDTIRFEVNKVKFALKVDTVLKNIFVEAVCPPDTVRVKVAIPCEQIKTGYSIWNVIGFGLVLLVVGALLSRLLWR